IHEMKHVPEDLENHIILVGCHVQGQEILNDLVQDDEDVLIVEYDSQIIDNYSEKGHYTFYGDINHVDFVNELNADSARMIISTVPKKRANTTCIEAGESLGLPVIARSNSIDDALEMYREGASYVILPDLLSAEKASELIIEGLEQPDRLEELREHDIGYLSAREEDLVLAEYGPAYLQHVKDELQEN
ncbi:MAG: NAD(P)-binding protein, partial [Candidatus Nanohaloarchaea archaeon]|nr:NAD(P)-binding protein [Candidatus Nanohaloarchaea archaeon]